MPTITVEYISEEKYNYVEIVSRPRQRLTEISQPRQAKKITTKLKNSELVKGR